MSLAFATQLTAVATTVLAAFAIVTAAFAVLAFRKQSAEVRAIEQQAALQSEQFAARRLSDVAEAQVLHLQAQEIRASLEQRERDADERRRSQAAKVTAWFASEQYELPPVIAWGAKIRNASDLPVLDVRVSFHYIQEEPGGGWAPVMRGTSTETIQVLPPLGDRFTRIPDQVRTMLDRVDDSIYAVSIEFTDAAGNRWDRDPRGSLTSRS